MIEKIISKLQLPNIEIKPSEVKDFASVSISISYTVLNKRDFFSLSLNRNWDEILIGSLLEKFKTLIFNNVNFGNIFFSQREDLISFIESNYMNYNATEKLENIVSFVSKGSTFQGNRFQILNKQIQSSQIWRGYYYDSNAELLSYLRHAHSKKYIEFEDHRDGTFTLMLTFEGILFNEQIRKNRDSRFCFIAMSFDEEMDSIYKNGILPALNETKFLPYKVNDLDIDTNITINDAIIAGIKKARFTIADFTGHKLGVYFEAGYALGRGQKVIYTCREDKIGDAHFDTKPYQHILWKNAEDLKQKLIDRIEAIVLD